MTHLEQLEALEGKITTLKAQLATVTRERETCQREKKGLWRGEQFHCSGCCGKTGPVEYDDRFGDLKYASDDPCPGLAMPELKTMLRERNDALARIAALEDLTDRQRAALDDVWSALNSDSILLVRVADALNALRQVRGARP